MMPRWLQGLVALASGIVVSIGLIVAIALIGNLAPKGEQPFSSTQRYFLQENYPNGVFISDKTFRWCEGRVFYYVTPGQGVHNYNEQCMTDLPRR